MSQLTTLVQRLESALNDHLAEKNDILGDSRFSPDFRAQRLADVQASAHAKVSAIVAQIFGAPTLLPPREVAPGVMEVDGQNVYQLDPNGVAWKAMREAAKAERQAFTAAEREGLDTAWLAKECHKVDKMVARLESLTGLPYIKARVELENAYDDGSPEFRYALEEERRRLIGLDGTHRLVAELGRAAQARCEDDEVYLAAHEALADTFINLSRGRQLVRDAYVLLEQPDARTEVQPLWRTASAVETGADVEVLDDDPDGLRFFVRRRNAGGRAGGFTPTGDVVESWIVRIPGATAAKARKATARRPQDLRR